MSLNNPQVCKKEKVTSVSTWDWKDVGHLLAVSFTSQSGKEKATAKKLSYDMSATEGMWETLKPAGRRFYDLMWLKLSFLAIKINATSGISSTLSISRNRSSPLWIMMVAASRWGAYMLLWSRPWKACEDKMNAAKYTEPWRKTWWGLQDTCRRRFVFFSKTMTRSIKSKLHKNG